MAWENGTVAGEYLTGYLIERSLSIDNLFVFALLFCYFAVPARRSAGSCSGASSARSSCGRCSSSPGGPADAFHWMIYVFGALLVFTGVRMALRTPTRRSTRSATRCSGCSAACSRSPNEYDGDSFVTRDDGKRLATPLFAALVLVATFDVVFAIDSIPAIFAITRDTFIVFAAERVLAARPRVALLPARGAPRALPLPQLGLAAVLVWVGVKMLITDIWHVPR